MKKAKFTLTGSQLKLLAACLMFLDHIGAALLEVGAVRATLSYETIIQLRQLDFFLRSIGRLSFPIYCFLLAEGFHFTKNVSRYAARLGLFAILSELPFDLAFSDTFVDNAHQNVYFTLFLSLLTLIWLESWLKCPPDGIPRFLSRLLPLGCGAATGALLHVDYGAFGVLFPVLLWWFREEPGKQTFLGCAALLWEFPAPLAFLPIRLYGGERGKHSYKIIFYLFYPVHLLILYGLRQIIW